MTKPFPFLLFTYLYILYSYCYLLYETLYRMSGKFLKISMRRRSLRPGSGQALFVVRIAYRVQRTALFILSGDEG